MSTDVIPTIWVHTDRESARSSAMEAAQSAYRVALDLGYPTTAERLSEAASALTPDTGLVACTDKVHPKTLMRLVTYARNGRAVLYGTRKPYGVSGLLVRSRGLLPDLDVYIILRNSGMSDADAAQGARVGRGDVQRALKSKELLSKRSPVLKLLRAIEEQEFTATLDMAKKADFSMVTMIREAVAEIRTEDFALWAEHEVTLLSKYVDFVERCLGDKYVKHPPAVVTTIAAGIYIDVNGSP